MAIDKAALRKGTRWIYLRHEVEVLEASDAFVVFTEPHGLAQVAPLAKFMAGAHDPSTFEHGRLIEGLSVANHDLPTKGATGDLLLLRDAALHLLERMPPDMARYSPPASVPAPAPKPEPVAIEPLPTVEPYPEADYAVAMPALPDDETERPTLSKRRHPKHDWRA